MKKLVLMFLLITVGLSKGYNYGSKKDYFVDKVLVNEYTKQLNSLNEEQKYWMQYVYRRCMKYNLGNTCVAIAWEESQFGVYKVIPWSGDYGLMGINLYWYMKDNGYNYRDRYLRSRLATRLTCDDDYNIMYSIAKLEKLKERYKRWREVWAHYNGGIRSNWIYAKKILNKIIAFRRFISKE